MVREWEARPVLRFRAPADLRHPGADGPTTRGALQPPGVVPARRGHPRPERRLDDCECIRAEGPLSSERTPPPARALVLDLTRRRRERRGTSLDLAKDRGAAVWALGGNPI